MSVYRQDVGLEPNRSFFYLRRIVVFRPALAGTLRKSSTAQVLWIFFLNQWQLFESDDWALVTRFTCGQRSAHRFRRPMKEPALALCLESSLLSFSLAKALTIHRGSPVTWGAYVLRIILLASGIDLDWWKLFHKYSIFFLAAFY